MGCQTAFQGALSKEPGTMSSMSISPLRMVQLSNPSLSEQMKMVSPARSGLLTRGRVSII